MFNSTSPSISAVSQWDLALTSGASCADLIGANDVTFSTGAPTADAIGVVATANVQGNTGITSNAYSVAYIAKTNGTGIAVGGGVATSNYLSGFVYTSSVWRPTLITTGTANTMNTVLDANAYEMYFFSRNAAGNFFASIFANPGFAVMSFAAGANAHAVTLCDVEGVAGRKFNGTLADVIYWDRFINDWQFLNEEVYPYMQTLAAAKSITI